MVLFMSARILHVLVLDMDGRLVFYSLSDFELEWAGRRFVLGFLWGIGISQALVAILFASRTRRFLAIAPGLSFSTSQTSASTRQLPAFAYQRRTRFGQGRSAPLPPAAIVAQETHRPGRHEEEGTEGTSETYAAFTRRLLEGGWP